MKPRERTDDDRETRRRPVPDDEQTEDIIRDDERADAPDDEDIDDDTLGRPVELER